MKATETISLEQATITLETGELARQAHGAVVVRHERSLLLATVVADDAPDPRARDFLPLTVNYREWMSAAGRIPGGYLRREGRSSDDEILISRLIDRALRPRFPLGWDREVQVIVTVYSADKRSDLPTLALLAAGAALHVSDVPFDGPVAGLRVTRHGETWHLLAPPRARGRAALDVMVAAGRDGLIMAEGGAREQPEATLLEALAHAREALAACLDALDRLRQAAGVDKRVDLPLAGPEPAAEGPWSAAWGLADKRTRRAALRRAEAEWIAARAGAGVDAVSAGAEHAAGWRRQARARTLAGGRMDGRAHDALRQVEARVGLLEGAHGSALFTRGETQALVSVTLGTTDEARTLENVFGKRSEQLLLQYSFPPFSVGEIRPDRGPGRREVGHGALAHRALEPLLPKRNDLPWTVRVVSEILESNGSSSMATVCGASLALMDAGVALRAPVAGVAMGLIREGDQVAVLTDILGDEDHLGDMDFKLAGTRAGLTAFQLDNKRGALSDEILAKAVAQARAALDQLLDGLEAVLPAPRPTVAAHAPQVAQLEIPKGAIGRVIGTGGRTVQEVQSRTKTRIEIREDGRVRVFAKKAADLARGVAAIEALTLELEVGGVYRAEVISVKDYGAFVRIGEHEGLVHVSQLEQGRTDSVKDVVSVGERVLVKVLGADSRGRLDLSRKAALGAPEADVLNG